MPGGGCKDSHLVCHPLVLMVGASPPHVFGPDGQQPEEAFCRRTMPASKLVCGGFLSVSIALARLNGRGPLGSLEHMGHAAMYSKGLRKWLTLHLREQKKKSRALHTPLGMRPSPSGGGRFSPPRIWRCAAHQRPSRTSTADLHAFMT